MRQIENQNLAQLLVQLRFTPQGKRQEQLESAIKLLSIIDKEKEYPFEFVCFRITGHRPKGHLEWESIRGDKLKEDLQLFISKLSSMIAPMANEQSERVFTTEELAKELGISTKTIGRWRKRGLVARKICVRRRSKTILALASRCWAIHGVEPEYYLEGGKIWKADQKGQAADNKAGEIDVK